MTVRYKYGQFAEVRLDPNAPIIVAGPSDFNAGRMWIVGHRFSVRKLESRSRRPSPDRATRRLGSLERFEAPRTRAAVVCQYNCIFTPPGHWMMASRPIGS